MHALAGIEEGSVDLVVKWQAVLLENQVSAIGGNAADPRDILHFAAGRLDLNARNRAEQICKALGCDLLHVDLRERIDGVGHVKAALRARRTRDNDVRRGSFGLILRRLGSGNVLRKRSDGQGRSKTDR
jgi:hypothetical protein